MVKNPPACQCKKDKRRGFDAWVGRSPGEGHGSPEDLEDPMNRFLPGGPHEQMS